MVTKHQDDTQLKERPNNLKPPSMWQVVMYNDDYTPMEFVTAVLEQFFGHTRERAIQTMLKIHTEGRGICGLYSHDVAVSKIKQVIDHAQEYEHPLRCGMEPI